MKKFAIVGAAVAAFGLVSAARAAVAGTDNTTAAAYADGWSSGDNGSVSGNAFGAWTLTAGSPTGGFAGSFIGDSRFLARDGSGNGVGADINSNGSAFGQYANQNSGAAASAARSFNGALSVGQTFSVDLALNYRNGNKGLDIVDAAGNNIFNFNTGGDDYSVNNVTTGNGSIGNAYSNNTAFNVALTQTTATGGTWTITRSGGVSDIDTGTYTGVANGFNLYVNGTDGGDENNLFANNYQINVPEPASLAVIGLGAVGLLRRRTK